jgi:serine protease Do
MKTIKIGRTVGNDVVVNNSSVSREHALILIDSDAVVIIRDLGSSNGTFVNNIKIKEQKLIVGDEVKLGSYRLNWEECIENNDSEVQSECKYSELDIKRKYAIGRSLSNDIVLPFEDISSLHAELLQMKNGDIIIIDKRSSNGTTVNGIKIDAIKIQSGDIVHIGCGHKLDWEQSLYYSKKSDNDRQKNSKNDDAKQSISKHEKHKKIDKNKYLVAAITAVFVIVMVIGAVLIKKNQFPIAQNKPISKVKEVEIVMPINVMEKYKNSVVFLYFEYVYKLQLGDSVYFLMTIDRNNNKVEYYNPITNNSLSGSATGFFVSTDGKIITNQHVVFPWEYNADLDKKIIREFGDDLIAKLIAELIANKDIANLKAIIPGYVDDNSVSGLKQLIKNNRALNNINIQVTGERLFMGAALNNTYIQIDDKSDYMKCVQISQLGNKKIDVAMIQLSNKRLPKEVENIINLDDAIIDNKSLIPGIKLFMIGYPAGKNLGDTDDGIKSHYQEGILSREPDDIDFGHNLSATGGSSGSPIFNEQGQFVGVMNKGYEQTFNFAILAKHVKNLIQ